MRLYCRASRTRDLFLLARFSRARGIFSSSTRFTNSAIVPYLINQVDHGTVPAGTDLYHFFSITYWSFFAHHLLGHLLKFLDGVLRKPRVLHLLNQIRAPGIDRRSFIESTRAIGCRDLLVGAVTHQRLCRL